MPKEDLITLRSLLLDYQQMLERNVQGDVDATYISNVAHIVEDIEDRVQYTPSP